jgi:hypothetical protein
MRARHDGMGSVQRGQGASGAITRILPSRFVAA